MGLTAEQITDAADVLRGVVVETPVLTLSQSKWGDSLPDASVSMKLELFQQTGSFKARGAYLGIAGLDATARAAGVPSVLVTFGPAGDDMAALEPEALLHDYADLPDLVPRLVA